MFRASEIGAVIHFAAHAYVGESVRHPRKYFQNNVTNTLNLLDAMLDAGVHRIVFSSTCATYGEPERIPIAEDHSQTPLNPYGESKRFVERVLSWYGKAYGLEWLVLRYFNAAGADLDGEIGEDHDPETHLIPLVIQAGLGIRRSVDVFGEDYATPDGTAVRDYVHVTDLADAHIRSVDYLAAGGPPLVMNLGSGTATSVREIIRAVEEVGGRPVPVNPCPRRPGDPAILLADASRARTVLGWAPRHPLKTIVETAWQWHSRILIPTDSEPAASL